MDTLPTNSGTNRDLQKSNGWLGKSSGMQLKALIQSEVPCIGRIRRENETLAKAAVIEEIIKVVEFVHSFHTMTPAQVSQTADMILKKFYFLRLDEITLAFENGIAGEYGEVKKMDGTVILKWLDDYDGTTRSKAVIEANKDLQSNNIYEANQVWNLTNEATGKSLGDAFNEVQEKAKKDRLTEMVANPPDRPKTEVDGYMQEFDALYKTDWISGPVRMVRYLGEIMDQTKFIQTRSSEEAFLKFRKAGSKAVALTMATEMGKDAAMNHVNKLAEDATNLNFNKQLTDAHLRFIHELIGEIDLIEA